jgi:hypothetical protein
MEPTHTATTVAALIRARMEPTDADAVLDALRPYNGQLITTRLLDKLPGGRVEWRLSRVHGWTELSNATYRRSQGGDGLSLHLAHSEASVPLDVAWVERENARYFGARRERNQQRAAALADPGMLARLATLMNEIEDLQGKLAFARETFAEFTDAGQPCHPDRYTLEAACGLREERS